MHVEFLACLCAHKKNVKINIDSKFSEISSPTHTILPACSHLLALFKTLLEF